MRSPVIIATRGSDLALWQARYVQSLLNTIGLKSELNIIKTQGDNVQHLSLDKLEGKGFFTKEIEDALLSNEADIAVHSHKDLPTESPVDLIIAAVSNREDASELLLIRKEAVDVKKKFSLKKNAVVGTSSARRKAQLMAFRNDLQLKDLRGNVPTRVNKLREGQYDAILLAVAGVERLELNIEDFHAEKLDIKEFIPAPAQGVLAIQIRKSDNELYEKLQAINNASVANTIAIERKVLNLFEGGCHMPVGAYAEYDENTELYKVWVSKAETANDLPVGIYLQSKHAEGMAERIVDKIKSLPTASQKKSETSRKVFITRNLKQSDYFYRVLNAHGYEVSGKALIEMEPIPFGSVPQTDWIFFSSKNAVKYFFEQKPVLGNQKLGCIGKATADVIRRYCKRADFIGYSTDTKLTGKQFASQAGMGTVLFPMAKGSLRSIQNGFVKQQQVIDLIVYETIKRNQEAVPFNEIVVFTSPSNVEAYFEKNKFTSGQKAIAMGEATASALKKQGINHAVLTDAFNDVALCRAVFSISYLITIQR